jgi:multiple sugar transport system ATP-binding protein
MSRVSFRDVTKSFGEVTAVDSLSLEIADQEFMVLLGPSGCGKTTALRMIAGLESVTSGELSIGDQVVNDLAASDRDIAMVFQSYALYPHMSVARNIESPLVARKSTRLPEAERQARVNEAAAQLGLTDYMHRKPGELSGGQRQRVALARAIVRRPEVFLMDEPLSNLDAKLRTQTRLELVELWRRLGTTFVYVTHDQVEAMTMATRVAIIEGGRLQQVGAPQAVYERPANLFVAQFIGSPPMNTLEGSWSTPGTVSTRCGQLELGPRVAARDGDIVLGVRPEHVEFADDGLNATVLAVEMLGHEAHIICQLDERRWVVRHPTDGLQLRAGDATRLRVDPTHVHVFDASTGDRID